MLFAVVFSLFLSRSLHHQLSIFLHTDTIFRVPLLGEGSGQLHTTPHCVVVTALGAELASLARHTRNGGGFITVRSCGATESRTVFCGGGGSGRSTSVVGKARSRELCEALELARCTLRADHLRFFTSNHSRPQAATINTTMMLHGIDEVGASLDGFTREGDLTSMLLTEDVAMVCS